MKLKQLKKILQGSIGIFLMTTSSILNAQGYTSVALHSEIDRVQPMTGIVFWSDNQSDLNTLGDKVQLEYSYLVYNEVINQENNYDWGIVDNLLANAASRGNQMIIRFRYTYPGYTTPSVPDYVRNSAGYTDRTESVEGQNTYIPDWSSTELQDFTKEFFTEFADRYDNDPRLAFLQIGFGSYSEYHLYDGRRSLGDTFPSKAYQTEFLNHVDAAFGETQWGISIDASSSSYSPFSSSADLRNLNFGLFDDSFLHESHSTNNNEYNRSSWLLFGEDRADTNAAGGELNYYSQWDQEHVLDVAGPYGFTFEEMAELYDITYMIGNDQLAYQTANRIEDAAMATGYQFEVTEYATNGVSTQLTIKNNGIAPIYYDAYPAIGNVNAAESLKGLTAGNSKTFTINAVAAGEDLTIACSRLVQGQEIQFVADIDAEALSVTDFEDVISNVKVYPNPFSESITIANVSNKKLNLKIFNMLGGLLMNKELNITEDIDTSDLVNGVYLIQVSQGDLMHTKVFVKR